MTEGEGGGGRRGKGGGEGRREENARLTLLPSMTGTGSDRTPFLPSAPRSIQDGCSDIPGPLSGTDVGGFLVVETRATCGTRACTIWRVVAIAFRSHKVDILLRLREVVAGGARVGVRGEGARGGGLRVRVEEAQTRLSAVTTEGGGGGGGEARGGRRVDQNKAMSKVWGGGGGRRGDQNKARSKVSGGRWDGKGGE